MVYSEMMAQLLLAIRYTLIALVASLQEPYGCIIHEFTSKLPALGCIPAFSVGDICPHSS